MSPPAAGALVFGTSAAVLVLEILAGRLLAPYVGVTLETYTGIIGVVLAGISLGTWYGGRLADRVDPRRTLGTILMLGGAAALCTIPAIRLFGAVVQGSGPVGVVLLSVVGFFAPAAILSAVTPTVVKLQLHNLDETGAVVGRLSAMGTAGAIIGTFVTGFFLVAAFPSTPVVVGLGVLLVVTGFALRVRLAGRAGASSAGPLALALLAASLTAAIPGPCQYESAYFCAQVLEDLPPCNGRTLFLDTLRHSCVHLDDPTALDFSYAQILADVIGTIGDGESPLDALHIGGGGFTMPRYLAATRPGSDSLVLELDPTLVRIAHEELGLRTSDELQVQVGDARVAVRDLPRDTYDLVIGDAFGGEAVPWHLTTTEFIRQVKTTMTEEGVYAINLIDHPPLGFARAEAATLRAVFAQVAVVAPAARVDRREGGNFVLVASDGALDTDGIAAANARRGDDDEVATGRRLDTFIGESPVMTDDYAPVDQLLTPLN
ncbi:MAG: spermidine synthase [Nitriliruptorales bacterium]|nr:spermidine synthase [Nitriliruptorales bacterium]